MLQIRKQNPGILINYTSVKIFSCVIKNPNMGASNIAKKTKISTPTTYRILNSLAKSGLLHTISHNEKGKRCRMTTKYYVEGKQFQIIIDDTGAKIMKILE